MRYLLGFSFVCLSVLCFAQENVIIQGQVLDRIDSTPVAFTHIWVEDNQLGDITDFEGNFRIALPSGYDTSNVIISNLIYEEQLIPLTHFLSTQSLTIYLKKKTFSIDTAFVYGLSAEAIIRQAVEKIPENYGTEPFEIQAFYRQVHKENGQYVRLIEADVALADKQAYSKHKEITLKEWIKVNQLRRSFVYERNGDEHDDHLVDLLRKNPIRYNGGTVLALNNQQIYQYQFDSVHGDYRESDYHIIHYFLNKNTDNIQSGTLVIKKEDLAIIHAELHEYPNPKALLDERSDWKFQNGSVFMTYAKDGDHYRLSESKWYYNHHIWNSTFGRVDYVVEETFHLIPHGFYACPESLKGYDKLSNLYHTNYEFDTEFWTSYPVLSRYPLDSEIKKDLEKKTSLSDQFARGDL